MPLPLPLPLPLPMTCTRRVGVNLGAEDGQGSSRLYFILGILLNYFLKLLALGEDRN